ncbi:MAG: putative cytokinetic ring protein SteA [Actinomycetaceae bacterium]|nr:putative cytokinetic ring protein SteA [Actinomycetaceae bacterium]
MSAPIIHGRVRIDERPQRLASRLEAGEIAVIDQPDLDRATAQALIAARPAAILNAAPSATGRTPVLGPGLIISAGVPLIDDLGSDLMTLREGDQVAVRGGEILRGDTLIASGIRRENNGPIGAERIATSLTSFAASVDEYLEREGDIVLEGVGVPTLPEKLQGRPILILSDGTHLAEELRGLKSWIGDCHPVIIAVDRAAEIAIKSRNTPDVIIGDMELLAEKTLRCGAELITLSGEGDDGGGARLARLGLTYQDATMAALAEDAAVNIAARARPVAIVVAGGSSGLADFLDRSRATMAPAFLTRLLAQNVLVSAPAIIAAHRPRPRSFGLFLLALAMVFAVLAALWSTPWGHALLSSLIPPPAAVSSPMDTPAPLNAPGNLL